MLYECSDSGNGSEWNKNRTVGPSDCDRVRADESTTGSIV